MRLLLVDGSGFVYRAFFALPKLTRRSDDHPTGAVYGFCQLMISLLKDKDDWFPTHIAVIFDGSKKNWRHEIDPGYKSNRDETQYDLRCQFSFMRRAVDAFGVCRIEAMGYEADDFMATYARMCSEQDGYTKLVTGDKDMMQLINDKVEMYDVMKKRMVTDEDVMEKFGVVPALVPDVQALCGDVVDKVPGVPGIGPKKAANLINQFGSLESALQNVDMISNDKQRDLLEEYAGQARMCHELVKLDHYAPVDVGFDAMTHPPRDGRKLAAFFKEMEFTSIDPIF